MTSTLTSFICLRCGHTWEAEEPPDRCPNRNKPKQGRQASYRTIMDRRFFPTCGSFNWDTPGREIRKCAGCSVEFEAPQGNQGRGRRGKEFHTPECATNSYAIRNRKSTGDHGIPVLARRGRAEEY